MHRPHPLLLMCAIFYVVGGIVSMRWPKWPIAQFTPWTEAVKSLDVLAIRRAFGGDGFWLTVRQIHTLVRCVLGAFWFLFVMHTLWWRIRVQYRGVRIRARRYWSGDVR